MEFRTYLEVPFAEKDAAKALGAKWNPAIRKWYVPEGCDLEPFKTWLPVWDDEDNRQWIRAPLFIAESKTICWSCKGATLAIAFAVEMTNEDGDPYISMLSHIEELPPELSGIIAGRYPFFKKQFSRTARMKYFMNHCRCGASLGDFYMHDEPGGCFCPVSSAEARKILLRRFVGSGCVVLKSAGYSFSTDDFIGRYALRSTL